MRAGRLFALVRLLEERGRTTARDLAVELEVSERTVLRDIDELSGAGVPVLSHRGRNGGFELLGRADIAHGPTSAARSTGTGTRVLLAMSPRARRMATILGRPGAPRVRRSVSPPPGRPDWITVSVRVESLDSAVFDLLPLGDGIEVLEPRELRTSLRATARAIVALNA